MPNYKRIFKNGHSYFLTITTYGRNPILIENIQLLRESFWVSKQNYMYDIDAIVVLPDHLHMIMTPKISIEYSQIISSIKRSFVYGLDAQIKEEAKSEISASKYRRSHAGIWQERFYEHTIRDEKDWLEKMEYIHYNPLKHALVEDIKDWKYTSFT